MSYRPWSFILDLIALSATLALAGCFEQAAPDTPSGQPGHVRVPTPHTAPTIAKTVAITTGSASSTDHPGISNQSDVLNLSASPTVADFTRSSWENPFQPRLWTCQGWKISDRSMSSESPLPARATFFRPYRNLVIECRLARSTEIEVNLSSTSPMPFEIGLVNESTGNRTGLMIDSDKASLVEARKERESVLKVVREVSFDACEEPDEITVRLTLTPNRILVAIDGHLRINAARPATIMNTDCRAQFVVHQPGIKLSDLRFEGN